MGGIEFIRLERQLADWRRGGVWQPAYELLERLLETTSGEARGWTQVQLALTRWTQSPMNVQHCLRATDEALPLLESNLVTKAKGLMNGCTYAVYARDLDRLAQYALQVRVLLRIGGADVVPWFGRLLGSLGYTYTTMGRRDQAEDMWRRAVEFYQDNLGPFGEHDQRCQLTLSVTALVEILLQSGRTEEGAALLSSLRSGDHDLQPGYISYVQGCLDLHEGRVEEAIRHLTEALTAATDRNDHELIRKAAIGAARGHARLGDCDRIPQLLDPLISTAAHARLVPVVISLQSARKELLEVSLC